MVGINGAKLHLTSVACIHGCSILWFIGCICAIPWGICAGADVTEPWAPCRPPWEVVNCLRAQVSNCASVGVLTSAIVCTDTGTGCSTGRECSRVLRNWNRWFSSGYNQHRSRGFRAVLISQCFFLPNDHSLHHLLKL